MYILIGIVVIILLTGFRIVRSQTVRVIEFFGKYNRIIRPGLGYVVPLLERDVYSVQLRTLSHKMSVDSFSKDNVRIGIGIDLLYYIKDDERSIYQSYYALENPRSTIQSLVDNALRAKINEFQHIEVLAKREEFSDYLEEILREKLSQWGYTIDSVQITEINLPDELVQAMNAVKTSERKKEAAHNEGEAHKIYKVKEAEADQESKRLQGLGIAQQREEVAKGLKSSVMEFQEALGKSANPNDIMNIILLTNYFDTLKSIGESDNAKIIMLDGSPEGVKNLRNQIMASIQTSQ